MSRYMEKFKLKIVIKPSWGGANATCHVSRKADLDKMELWEGAVTRPQVRGAKSCPGQKTQHVQHVYRSWSRS